MTVATMFMMLNNSKDVVTMSKNKVNFAERQKELKQELKIRERGEILRERRAIRRDKEYDFSEVTRSQGVLELPELLKTITIDRLVLQKSIEKHKAIPKVYTGEAYIQRNIKLELLGLSLIEYEYVTEMGYIDILCTDKIGQIVVIEVKKGIAEDSAVGQILGYMNAIGKNCRGMIIAGGFTTRVICAVKYLNIELIDYEMLL